MILGHAVIRLEGVETCDRSPGLRIIRRPQPRKQALFFIGRVAGRRRPEVVQGRREDIAILGRELRSPPGIRDDHQHRQELLDAPMAIAEKPQRSVESMIRRLSDPHEHAHDLRLPL